MLRAIPDGIEMVSADLNQCWPGRSSCYGLRYRQIVILAAAESPHLRKAILDRAR